MQISIKVVKFQIYESYIPQKKAQNMYNTNSKGKKYNFLKKDWFLEIFDFFPKGGPFDVETVKKNFPFFKNFKNKIEK